jgi:hypothetical protein
MLRLRLRRRRQLVRVHVQNGPSLEGVFICRRRGHYVLELAKLLEAHANPVKLDGWVEVPEKTVVFLQLLADEAD